MISSEFVAELQRLGQLVTDYIVNFPAVRKVAPDYLKEGVLFYVKKGGKRLRPAILIWAAEAVGGQAELVLPAAAAIELSHTWTLVHDDIIDHDDVRRGGPSMHAYYRETWRSRINPDNLKDWSQNLAMLVGDIQQALATSMLNALPVEIDRDLVRWLINDLATNWVTEVLNGEMLDVEYATRSLDQLTETDILSMLDKKTASTLSWCGQTGALLGLNKLEPDHHLVKLMAELCRQAGLAFQLQDDILGIIGDEKELGKPVGSDIREGKRTVLVAYAYHHADAAGKLILQNILGKNGATPNEIDQVRAVLSNSGSIDYVRGLAADYTAQAQQLLNQLSPSKAATHLQELVSFITQRKY